MWIHPIVEKYYLNWKCCNNNMKHEHFVNLLLSFLHDFRLLEFNIRAPDVLEL